MRIFDFPTELKQPNGEIINCFASGDDHYNWLHDKNGYLIIRSETNGFYTYANYIDGKIVGSEYIVKNDLEAKVVIANENKVKGLVTIYDVEIPKEDIFHYNVDYGIANIGDNEVSIQAAPTTGTINNIVIFIRFSDDPNFPAPISTYNNMFNDTTSGASSVYNYFLSTSYNQLTINSSFFPITVTTSVASYQDGNARSYYEPYNAVTNLNGYQTDAQRTTREQTLLANAVNAISAQVPPGLVVDSDGDGRVDDVTFIVYGGNTGWNTLLWPHMWVLYTQNVSINGARVWDYNFEINDMLDVGVICHETQHVIGFPDLYNYTANPINPVGRWDLMNADLNPPQYSLAHCKYKYGSWLTTIPEITMSGTYTLNALSTISNNSYRFKDTVGPVNEYFTIEYRRRDNTFENSLPGSGLIVCRIDSTLDGNASGPPNEVYVFRPGGTTVNDGILNNAFLSLESGRTSIGGPANPLFYSDGTQSGIKITNISSAGTTISFNIALNKADITANKTADKLYATTGDSIAYTVVMKNLGAVTATDVVIIDTIANGTNFVSGTYQYGGSTTSIANPASPGINLGTISSGATGTITLNVVVS